jgi:hypothetical protein
MREERNMMTGQQGLNVSANTATVTGDFKTTISLNSGVSDGMMRKCCRRGEDPTTMMILDGDVEPMLRRRWPTSATKRGGRSDHKGDGVGGGGGGGGGGGEEKDCNDVLRRRKWWRWRREGRRQELGALKLYY